MNDLSLSSEICHFLVKNICKKESFYLDIPRKALLLHPSSCPGGGIGRRAGLKIQCPLKTCGFDSRPGYKKIERNPLGQMIERVFLLGDKINYCNSLYD